MDRSNRSFPIVLASLVVVVAACAGPTSVTQDPYPDEASTLGTSSKLSWSYGTAVLAGQVAGLGSTEAEVQGVAVGGYPSYCQNNGGGQPGGFMLTASNSEDRHVEPDRRGAIKFGDKKNETEFVIDNPYEPAGLIQAPELKDAYCSNGHNWTLWIDSDIFYITHIYLRFGTEETGWTNLSWDCVTEPVLTTPSTTDATMTCTPTGSSEPPGGWDSYYPPS
jgi:hypothetical protein